MKLYAVAACAILMLASHNANAAIVDFDGLSVNMGLVAKGQEGTLYNNFTEFTIPFGGGTKFATNLAYGQLPGASKITFTYTLPQLGDNYALTSGGVYLFDNGADTYSGLAFANEEGVENALGYLNGNPSMALVLATSNVDGILGTTTITNRSNHSVGFETIFAGLLKGSPSLTYAVSAIPLPAALPMFLTLLGGMFAFARKRRKARAAA